MSFNAFLLNKMIDDLSNQCVHTKCKDMEWPEFVGPASTREHRLPCIPRQIDMAESQMMLNILESGSCRVCIDQVEQSHIIFRASNAIRCSIRGVIDR